MEAVYQWMKNIVYFLLLVGVVRNLTSREYQKYMGLAIGLCLVLLIAAPAMKYVSGDEFSYYLEWNELDADLAWNEISGKEGEWREGVVSQYCQLLKEQAGALLKDYGVSVTRVELQMEDGKVITGLSIWASIGGPDAGEGKKIMEEISITDIIIRLDAEEADALTDTPELALLKLNIKTELADFYDMDASHINVIIS